MKIKKMDPDKLRSLQEVLGGIFTEPAPISTRTESSSPTAFDPEPYDAAQQRGETKAQPDNQAFSAPEKADAPETITPKELHEASTIDEKSPNLVRRTLAEHPPLHSRADAENLAKAEQAKLLLAGLGIDTAIRLRWSMRDIRAKRTKFLRINEDDLAALIDLGFVEMQDGTPRLTGLGGLVLD